MLFETLWQPLIALYILGTGFLCGCVFDINNLIWYLCNKNKVVRFILDFLSILLCFIIFFFLILNISYGEVRFYQIVLFLLALFLQRITLGKLFAYISKKCYTSLVIIKNKIILRLTKNKTKILTVMNKGIEKLKNIKKSND